MSAQGRAKCTSNAFDDISVSSSWRQFDAHYEEKKATQKKDSLVLLV